MKNNNQTRKLSYYKNYSNLGDMANGEPIQTIVDIYYQKDKLTIEVAHTYIRDCFCDDMDTVYYKDERYGFGAEDLKKSIEELNLQNLEDIYESTEPGASVQGTWAISYDDYIKVGSSLIKVDEVEKFKELIEFNLLETQVKTLVMDRLSYDDKVRYAVENNVFNLDENLSYQDRRDFVESEIGPVQLIR